MGNKQDILASVLLSIWILSMISGAFALALYGAAH